MPALSLGVLCIAPHVAVAEPAANPSPGFDPRQAERRFDLQTETGRGGRPQLNLPRFGAAPAAAASTRPMFVLTRVDLDGAHALPPADLATAWSPWLGRTVSAADLEAIAAAITGLYRARGYHLSRAIVPPQDVKGGHLRIDVIEGSITEVDVEGGEPVRFGAPALVAPIRAERPSRQATVERQLLLLGERPGVRIADTQLQEIVPLSGRFRLVVKLATWTSFASFGVDDFGSHPIGPWQAYATLGLNSMLVPGDAASANFATVPNDPRTLVFARVNYDAPVTDSFRLGASAMSSTVRPSDWRSQFNDITRTDTAEIRASVAVVRSQDVSLTVTAAFDATNSSEADVFGPIYNDYIRTMSLIADARMHDGLGGNTYLTASWRQGLPLPGATTATDPFSSRFGAPADFGAFNAWITRYQPLGGGVSLKLAGATQLADAPLLLSQQFYLGGLSFGRGYDNSEVNGDNALAGTAELRLDHTVGWQNLKSVQLYGFVDSGVVWNYGLGIGTGPALTSTGGGIRFFLFDDVRADLGIGVPLTWRSPTNPDRSPRLLFSLSSAFRTCAERAELHCL